MQLPCVRVNVQPATIANQDEYADVRCLHHWRRPPCICCYSPHPSMLSLHMFRWVYYKVHSKHNASRTTCTYDAMSRSTAISFLPVLTLLCLHHVFIGQQDFLPSLVKTHYSSHQGFATQCEPQDAYRSECAIKSSVPMPADAATISGETAAAYRANAAATSDAAASTAGSWSFHVCS